MTIEQFHKIDMIVSHEDGKLRLGITDVGDLVDEDRNYAFKKKLNLYKSALEDPSFRSEHKGWQNTEVEIVYNDDPIDEMTQIASFTFEVDGQEYEVPVKFNYLESVFSKPSDEKRYLVEPNYNLMSLSTRATDHARDLIKQGIFEPFGFSWNADNKVALAASMGPEEDQIP